MPSLAVRGETPKTSAISLIVFPVTCAASIISPLTCFAFGVIWERLVPGSRPPIPLGFSPGASAAPAACPLLFGEPFLRRGRRGALTLLTAGTAGREAGEGEEVAPSPCPVGLVSLTISCVVSSSISHCA